MRSDADVGTSDVFCRCHRHTDINIIKLAIAEERGSLAQYLILQLYAI